MPDLGARPFPALLRHCLASLAVIGGRRLGLALGLAVAVALAEASGLLLLLPLLGAVGLAQGADLLPPLLGWAAVVVLHAGLTTWRDTLAAGLAERVTAERRAALHGAAANMEWSAFQADKAADLTAMLTVTTMRLGQLMLLLIGTAGRLAQMTAHVAVALWLAPLAAALAIVVGGGLALLRFKAVRRAFAGGRRQVLGARTVQAMVAEHVGSMKLAKAFAAERRHAAAFARRVDHASQSRTRVLAAQARERAIFRAAAAVVMAAMVWLLVAVLKVSGVPLLVLVAVFARLLPAAGEVMQQAAQLSELLAAWQRCDALLARCHAAAEPAAGEAAMTAGDIVLDAVGFRWPGRDAAALRQVSLTIPERATIAVVGPSGAGKSTLADLLLGLLAPGEGCIRVGGTPLDRAAWRRRTGYVPQDVFLFDDTVRANLSWARPDADEAALWRALEQAAVAEVVRDLPRGLDTVLGERGARLSGGERQRLAIARALLREPALLVLDEATSHLDRDAERAVQEALRALHGRMTIVVIAHRLATVRQADRIVVLQEGRVTAEGGWDELTARGDGWLARVVEEGVPA